VVAVILALSLQFCYYMLRVKLQSWVTPTLLIRHCRDALVMAFSTSSSTATMPVTYECLRNNLKLRKQSANLGALVGANFNNDGTALYESMAALFIAQLLGADLSLAQQLIIVLCAMAASIGAAGIPSSGMLTMTLVLTAVGLPDLITDTPADYERLAITLGRQPALQALLRQSPLQQEGNSLTVRLNDVFGDFRQLFGGERRGELERVSAILAAPGEALGALIGFESPLRSGRSVVALTGSSPAGMEAMLTALRDPEQVPRVQGDTALLSGGRVQAFRVSSTYTTGRLPPWLWPEYFMKDNPYALLGMLLVVLLLVPAPIYWVLRRRAAQRLRERSV
jgi:cellulose synthase (UDP-forming)